MIPRILLIGDSIRMGYAPLVRQKLEGITEIVEIPQNGGDSLNVLTHLSEWLRHAQAETLSLVHFNCGLHDIKRPFDSDERQQSISDYEDHLHQIVHILQRETDAQLIWATTTPVDSERHHATKGFDRFERDVEAYNQVALAIMVKHGVFVNDLHAVIISDSVGDCLGPDGVHFTPYGNELLSDAVVQVLRQRLRIC